MGGGVWWGGGGGGPHAAVAAQWEAISAGSASGASAPRSRWDETPVAGAPAVPGKKRSRWDDTPISSATGSATPLVVGGGASATPLILYGGGAPSATPSAAALYGAATPLVLSGGVGGATPADLYKFRVASEEAARNAPLSDADLDAMLPEKGYRILEPPATYAPIRTPARKALSTPAPTGGATGFHMGETPDRHDYGIAIGPSTAGVDDSGAAQGGAAAGLPFIKPEELAYFGKLLETVDEAALSKEEANERRIMTLLLKIKNGTPMLRKPAMRQLVEHAAELRGPPVWAAAAAAAVPHPGGWGAARAGEGGGPGAV